MAFKAGSIYGEAILDTKKWDSGIKRMDAGTKNIVKMGAAIAAGATVALLAIKGMAKIAGELIDAYKEQEMAETALASAIEATGKATEISTTALHDLASELQDVTLYGDEATISAMALLQNLGDLSQKGIERVTPLIQDMATALKMDLSATASLVGKTLGSSTNALTRYGVEVDMSGTKSEKLASVIEALEAKFGGAAIAAGDTATGALVKFNNAIGDLQEIAGGVIITAFQPIIKGATDFAEKLTLSITESQRLKEIWELTANTWNELTQDRIQDRRERLAAEKALMEPILERIRIEKAEFAVGEEITGAAKYRIIQLEAKLKLMRASAKVWEDEINVMIKAMSYDEKRAAAAAISSELQKRLQDAFVKTTAGQQAAADAARAVLEADLKYFQQAWHAGEKSIEITAVIVDLKRQLARETEALADSSAAYWEREESYYETIARLTDDRLAREEDMRKKLEKYRKTVEKTNREIVRSTRATWINIANIIARLIKKTITKIQNWANAIINAISYMTSSMADIFSMHYQNQLDTVTLETQAEMDLLQEKRDQEVLQEEAFVQTQQNRLDALQTRFDNDLISREEYAAQKKAIDEETRLKESASEEAYRTKKEEIEKTARDKRNKIEENAFNAEKLNKIAGVWIAAATSIMGWWANAPLLGPIAGPIFAGIMTAIILGFAGVQTGLIASQQFVPSKEAGGMAGGATRVNEAGGEIIQLPDQSLVIPHDISRQIAASAGGPSTIIHVSFAGAQISDTMDLERVTNTVIRKLGKQMRLAV